MNQQKLSNKCNEWLDDARLHPQGDGELEKRKRRMVYSETVRTSLYRGIRKLGNLGFDQVKMKEGMVTFRREKALIRLVEISDRKCVAYMTTK